jgi:hypothetical protein
MAISSTELAMHCGMPVYMNDTFFAFFGVDMSLQWIGQHLNNTVSDRSLTAFFLTMDGKLISVANRPVPAAALPDGTSQFINGNDYDDPVIAAISRAITNTTFNATSVLSIDVPGNGGWDYQAKQVNDKIGIGWYLVVAIQKRDFIATVANSNAGVIAGTASLLVLGLLTAAVMTIWLSIALCGINYDMRRIANMSLIDNNWLALRTSPLYEVQMMRSSLRAMKVCFNS